MNTAKFSLICLIYGETASAHTFDQLTDQKGCQRDRTPNLSY
jgi:hypothetical protein